MGGAGAPADAEPAPRLPAGGIKAERSVFSTEDTSPIPSDFASGVDRVCAVQAHLRRSLRYARMIAAKACPEGAEGSGMTKKAVFYQPPKYSFGLSTVSLRMVGSLTPPLRNAGRMFLQMCA